MVSLPTTPEEYRAWWEENTSAPYGYCWCGCGQQTNLARQNWTLYGLVRGEPVRYVRGHNATLPGLPYTVEDRGYSTPCWVWARGIDHKGYAQMSVQGRTRQAYAVFYERAKGPVPAGLQLDHLCSRHGGPRSCVNPDHLEPVTPAENVRRGRYVKLTIDAAREIRRLWDTGNYTQRELAGMFGVNRPAISKIVLNQRWAE